ncbi:DUF397 domain-containing protein [Streptosporangium longisporum]|uniref:DUF397 domain-containing protein n=1 Tax=Streptosporangium longisporum TaxID=46187 RepID=A0ABN3XP71_9ACTN
MDRELSQAIWVKSSLSGGNGGDCVEVARLSGARVGVRDSKDPSGPALVLTSGQWAAFTGWVRAGKAV